MEILPAITTTRGSDWKEKIKEAKKLGLKKACFFLTCLNLEQRKDFYELAEEIEAPFVHLRTDMEIWELDYLTEKHKTQVFNLHSYSEFPIVYDYSRYTDKIFIENIYFPLDEKELENFSGICLDFAHLENDRLMEPEKYKHNLKVLDKFKIGCNHISAIGKKVRLDDRNYSRYDKHSFEKLSEFDYLKKYPLKYFSDFTALELENSLEEQFKARKYILSLLK